MDTDKIEMMEIMKKLRSEVEESRKKSQQLEFDLREARYEVTQLTNNISKISEEKSHQEAIYKSQLQDFQLKLESSVRQNDEKYSIITVECDKLKRLYETLSITNDSSQGRTKKHVLSKVFQSLEKIRSLSANYSLDMAEIRNSNQNHSSKSHLSTLSQVTSSNHIF